MLEFVLCSLETIFQHRTRASGRQFIVNKLIPSANNKLLFKEAERLVDRHLHPQTIIAGWRKATEAAKKALDEMAEPARFACCNLITTSNLN